MWLLPTDHFVMLLPCTAGKLMAKLSLLLPVVGPGTINSSFRIMKQEAFGGQVLGTMVWII